MAHGSDSDSIYQSPASETNVSPEGDQMAVYVGKRFDSFYAARFAAFDRGANASWNWPAFFLTSFWFLYRKMWTYALLYWIVWPIALSIVAIVVGMMLSETASTLVISNIIYYGTYTLVGFVVIPIFANRIYYRHAHKKLAKVAMQFPDLDQQRLELARIGGTSNVVLVILPIILVAVIGILAAIAIPAYQDYTIRAQVSEGLSLSSGAKAAVTEHYMSTRDWPADNAEAGLASANSISGTYTASVAVDYGLIEVRYGNDAHELLSGASIILEPMTEADSVTWVCYSESIAPKHLPAVCR